MWTKVLAFFESIVLFFSGWFVTLFNAPDARTEAFICDNGGFIRGVCHPNENYDLLQEGGFNWVRFDIPYPYDRDGNVTGSYLNFRARVQGYADRGFKVMAITPYPKDYINVGGYDPSLPENEERVRKLAVEMYNDLKDICGGFQITNEMGVDTFTYPLTLEQAARFIGIQLEAIAAVKEDFPIGYNSAGQNLELHRLMRPYHQYCDYVGLDLYNGNTNRDNSKDYIKRIHRVFRLTKCPIILQEFGFLSEGKPKTEEEKLEILRAYGYESEAQARADAVNLAAKLPQSFQTRLQESWAPEDWGEAIFDHMRGHFYKEISGGTYLGFDHTPEGQAQYYDDLLPRLRNLSCVAGLIVYCCQDGSICWFCGQRGCPSETRWGITDEQGAPKPAYSVIQKHFTSEAFQ